MAEKKKNIMAFVPFGFGNKTELLQNRNRILTARYYYYFHILRRRPDDIYKLLAATEFFITAETVYRILTADEQNNYLNDLIKTHATAARLQKEFPGWRW